MGSPCAVSESILATFWFIWAPSWHPFGCFGYPFSTFLIALAFIVVSLGINLGRIHLLYCFLASIVASLGVDLGRIYLLPCFLMCCCLHLPIILKVFLYTCPYLFLIGFSMIPSGQDTVIALLLNEFLS